MTNKQEKEEIEVTEEVEVVSTDQSPQVAVSKDKTVKVIPKFSGKKFIASGWYEFTEEEEIEVPYNVARILRSQRKIYL